MLPFLPSLGCQVQKRLYLSLSYKFYKLAKFVYQPALPSQQTLYSHWRKTCCCLRNIRSTHPYKMPFFKAFGIFTHTTEVQRVNKQYIIEGSGTTQHKHCKLSPAMGFSSCNLQGKFLTKFSFLIVKLGWCCRTSAWCIILYIDKAHHSAFKMQYRNAFPTAFYDQ